MTPVAVPFELWPALERTRFFLWSRWRLGHKEFKQYGPGNMAVRPNVGYGARGQEPIPKRWWDEYKRRYVRPVLSPKPFTPNFFDTENGMYVLSPGGNVEHFNREVMTYQALDLNAGREYQWDNQRKRAAEENTATLPWLHCRTAEHIDRLIDEALEWKSPGLICNIEKEAETTLPPQFVAEKLARYMKPVAIIMVGWLYNSVKWEPLNKYPMFLELFPQESETGKDPEGCLGHAKQLLKSNRVYPCWGTHWGAKPSWYNMKGTHQLYAQQYIPPNELALWKGQ